MGAIQQADETTVSSPLPLAGEGGAKRRVRAVGKAPNATTRSRALRRTSTPQEQKLWSYLRDRRLDGFKFSRQYPIGPYIADFVCREAWLVVEVDGGQHSASIRDAAREQFLRRAGYGVLRFWNNEVSGNIAGVIEVLRFVLDGRPPAGLRYAPAQRTEH